MSDPDVLIAGGGPVGLMLASELALAGVRALVLVRRDDVDPTIKAGSINVATVEAFYRRGLLPAIRAEQERIAAFMRRGPAGGGPPALRLAGPALAALLVRPDGFVAWAADTGPAADTGENRSAPAPAEAAADALRRWFGDPGHPLEQSIS